MRKASEGEGAGAGGGVVAASDDKATTEAGGEHHAASRAWNILHPSYRHPIYNIHLY
jgi:hypothetical protein